MKANISKEELYNLYIKLNFTVQQIADKYGVSKSNIEVKLKNNNIKKDKKLCSENYKKIILEKYGVENISQIETVKKKKEETCFKKYGVVNPMKCKKVVEKSKNTNLKRYGTSNVMKNKDIQDKVKETMKQTYGVEFALQNKTLIEKQKETMNKLYGCSNPSKIKQFKDKMILTNNNKYGVPYACMTEQCRDANGYVRSKINSSFSNILTNNNIKNSQEFNLNKFSFDIKTDKNILIEINPTYTHNSTNGISFRNHYKKPTLSDYHFNKTIVAKENGYRCMHIWDWDNKEKIINMLKTKEKIYARKCEIREVDLEECTCFLEKNHLQGSCRGQKVRIGLFYNNELVQLMTFGKPRYNRNYEWELLRLCSSCNVVGGSSKLFNYFIKNYNPKNIISYCDNSKFTGNVYKKIGFKLLDYGKPSKHWYNMKTKQHITDNLLRQRGFDQLFKTNYGKGTSNKELMIQNGFVEVYDCGQSSYEYKRSEIDG